MNRRRAECSLANSTLLARPDADFLQGRQGLSSRLGNCALGGLVVFPRGEDPVITRPRISPPQKTVSRDPSILLASFALARFQGGTEMGPNPTGGKVSLASGSSRSVHPSHGSGPDPPPPPPWPERRPQQGADLRGSRISPGGLRT